MNALIYQNRMILYRVAANNSEIVWRATQEVLKHHIEAKILI